MVDRVDTTTVYDFVTGVSVILRFSNVNTTGSIGLRHDSFDSVNSTASHKDKNRGARHVCLS